MIYDDAPRSIFNPYKGQLYNEPDGENVYDSVPKDYIGGHITPHTFIAVLTGDKNAVKKKGTGRVIESKANDRVFVYFADHGAPGFVAFPSRFHVVPTQLKAETLMKALKKMHGAGQVCVACLIFIIEFKKLMKAPQKMHGAGHIRAVCRCLNGFRREVFLKP